MSYIITAKELNSFLKKHKLDTLTDFKRSYNIGEMQDAVEKVASGRTRDIGTENWDLFSKAQTFNSEETVIVSEPFGAELFEMILGSDYEEIEREALVKAGNDSNALAKAEKENKKHRFTCERLITMDENKQVKDIYLMYEGDTAEYDVRNEPRMGVAVLYVEMKTIGFNFICYKPIFSMPNTPSANECTTYLYQRVQEFVHDKAGIDFAYPDRAKEPNQEGALFPYTISTNDTNESILSRCKILNDVDVPAYISYNENDYWRANCSKDEYLARYGSLATSFSHSILGFSGYGPHTFYTPLAGDTDDAYEAITTHATYFNDPRCKVEMVHRSEDRSEKSSTSEVFKEVGVITNIYVGNSRGINDYSHESAQHSIGHYSRRQNGHAPHSVLKWEPEDTTPFHLADVPEVRVARLVGITEGLSQGETPSLFYVQSESRKWYEYNYLGTDGRLTKGQDILDFEVHGASDDSFFDLPHKEYVFGYLEEGGYSKNGWWFECDEVARLKDAADASKMKIKATHNKAYLVMPNDMRTVWDLCEKIQSNGLV